MCVFVIMPAFNEAQRIGDVLARMPDAVAGHKVSIVVVDDGSDDGTSEVASHFDVKVLRQSPNQGKGAALRRGLDWVRPFDFQAVVWMDSDGQHPPDLLADLALPVLDNSISMCVGSRYLRPSQDGKAPLNRRLVRKASIRVIEGITGCKVTDPYSGFRCFSPRAIDALKLDGFGYESELESTLAMARAGLTMLEVPIPTIYGPGTSKMAHYGRFRVIAGYVRTLWRARHPTGVMSEVERID